MTRLESLISMLGMYQNMNDDLRVIGITSGYPDVSVSLSQPWGGSSLQQGHALTRDPKAGQHQTQP